MTFGKRVIRLCTVMLPLFLLHPCLPVAAGGARAAADNLFVAVGGVLNALSSDRPPVLVDIRSREAFERCRIPGSINVPLAFVRTRTFLKAAPLVLVSRGYGQRFMETPCRRLRAAGFEAAIMLGGLSAWHQAGGKLAGDLTSLDLAPSITPQRFFQEKDAPYWLLVSTSPDPVRGLPAPFAAAVRVVAADRAAGVLRKLAGALGDRAGDPLLTVLAFSRSGVGDRRMQRTLSVLPGVPVVFLEGGLRSYRRFLTRRNLAIRSGRRQATQQAACPSCLDRR